MPRSYVDNAYNRRVGRVGMPVGSCVISRSGEYLGSREYVDNSYNRSLGRVGLPRGSCPASEYGDTWYTGKSTSDYGSSFYTKTPDEKPRPNTIPQEKKTHMAYPPSPLSKLSEQETRSVLEFDEAITPATPKLCKENNTRQKSELTKEVPNKQENVRDEGKQFDKKLEINQLKEKLLMQEKELKKKETDWLRKETTLNARIKNIDGENSTLKATLLKTEQDLARKTQELSSVEKKLENRLTNIREVTVESSNLKARLQKIEESLCRKEHELSDMKGKLNESEKNADGLAEVIKNCEGEQRKLADQLAIERQTTEVDGANIRKLSVEMTRLLECVAEKDQEIKGLKEIQESLETTLEDMKAEHAVLADTNRITSAKIKHYEKLLRCQHYERLFRRLQIDIDRERRENAYAWRLMTMLSDYMDVMQQKTSGNQENKISMMAFTAETQALLSNLAKQDQFILQLLNEREDRAARQTTYDSLA